MQEFNLDKFAEIGFAGVSVENQIFNDVFLQSVADYSLNESDYEQLRDFKTYDLLNNGREEIIVVSTIWNSTGDTTHKGLLQIFDFQDYTITLLDSLINSSSPDHIEFFQVKLWDIDDDGTTEVVIVGAIQNKGWSFIYVYNFTAGQLQFETETSWYDSWISSESIRYNDMIFADFDDDGVKEICTLTSLKFVWNAYKNTFRFWNLTSNAFLLENQYDFHTDDLELDWADSDNLWAFDIDRDNVTEILLLGSFSDSANADKAKLWALNYNGSALNQEAYTYWDYDTTGPTSLGLQIGDFDDDGEFEILAKFTRRDEAGDNLVHACYVMVNFSGNQFNTEFGQQYFDSGGGDQFNGDWLPINFDTDNEQEFISTDVYAGNNTVFLRIWDYWGGVLNNTENHVLATDSSMDPPQIRFLQGNSSLVVAYSKLDASGYKLFFDIIGDNIAPQISINSPTNGQFNGNTAPNFDILIIEGNLNSTWYTLDGGITNITFSGLTGTINQTEWDKKGDGPVTIRFYSNDTVGNEGYTEVTINKDIIAPTSQISFISYKEQDFVNRSTLFTISSDDGSGSGVSLIKYNINVSNYGLGWINYTTPFNLSNFENGEYYISYYAIDLAGNIESEKEIFISLRDFEAASQPGIPGYDIFLLISLLGVFSIILKKRTKEKLN